MFFFNLVRYMNLIWWLLYKLLDNKIKRERCAKEVSIIETLIQTILLEPKLQNNKVSTFLVDFCRNFVFMRNEMFGIIPLSEIKKTKNESMIKWSTYKPITYTHYICHIFVHNTIKKCANSIKSEFLQQIYLYFLI